MTNNETFQAALNRLNPNQKKQSKLPKVQSSSSPVPAPVRHKFYPRESGISYSKDLPNRRTFFVLHLLNPASMPCGSDLCPLSEVMHSRSI